MHAHGAQVHLRLEDNIGERSMFINLCTVRWQHGLKDMVTQVYIFGWLTTDHKVFSVTSCCSGSGSSHAGNSACLPLACPAVRHPAVMSKPSKPLASDWDSTDKDSHRIKMYWFVLWSLMRMPQICLEHHMCAMEGDNRRCEAPNAPDAVMKRRWHWLASEFWTEGLFPTKCLQLGLQSIPVGWWQSSASSGDAGPCLLQSSGTITLMQQGRAGMLYIWP